MLQKSPTETRKPTFKTCKSDPIHLFGKPLGLGFRVCGLGLNPKACLIFRAPGVHDLTLLAESWKDS